MRCILLVSWSSVGSNSNKCSGFAEAFTSLTTPPHATATRRARHEHSVGFTASTTTTSTRVLFRHGDSRRSRKEHHSRRSRGSHDRYSSARHTKVRMGCTRCHVSSMSAPQGISDGPLGNDGSRSSGSSGRSRWMSNRRRGRGSGPLFAEDQGWLEALQDMSGDSNLPMGPKKVRRNNHIFVYFTLAVASRCALVYGSDYRRYMCRYASWYRQSRGCVSRRSGHVCVGAALKVFAVKLYQTQGGASRGEMILSLRVLSQKSGDVVA